MFLCLVDVCNWEPVDTESQLYYDHSVYIVLFSFIIANSFMFLSSFFMHTSCNYIYCIYDNFDINFIL